MEEEAKSPPAVQEPPPEWVSEIHRLRSEVARFKASANRPVRDFVEAAMSVRAKAEKRRAGVMDNIPADEQSLQAWMEEKNLEMRDALDAKAIVSLGSVMAQGADQMRAFASRAPMVEQHGDRVNTTVRILNSRHGLRAAMVGEASN